MNIMSYGSFNPSANFRIVSRASPTRTSMFLMLFLANVDSAIDAYSGEYSRAVTCPVGPTAWEKARVEKPMNVPISRTGEC